MVRPEPDRLDAVAADAGHRRALACPPRRGARVNPSTAFARVLVDELVRGGVTDAVLAPGSRSAPVALALAAAERDGRLRLHVRIDERTAAFLALGLAKASGRPVPVLTTSGTAAAHLHAAVLEADASGVPLLALTADRPPELRATGANQTIEQAGLYGGAVRWAADVGVPEAGREAAQNRYWRSLVAKALITATGALSGDPGPVHLNLALREPLLPDDEAAELDRALGGAAGRRGLDGGAGARAGRAPSRRAHRAAGPWSSSATVRAALAARAAELADMFAWPVVAEPSSGVWGRRGPVRGGALLLGRGRRGSPAHRPERVVVVGRPTLSRPVSALLADPGVRVETVAASPRWADAARVERARRPGAPRPGGLRAGVRRVVRGLAAGGQPGRRRGRRRARRPPRAHRRPARPRRRRRAAGAARCSCSVPRRRCATSTGWPCRGATSRVLANRGVAGIDGTISTAIGAAPRPRRPGVRADGRPDVPARPDRAADRRGRAGARPDGRRPGQRRRRDLRPARAGGGPARAATTGGCSARRTAATWWRWRRRWAGRRPRSPRPRPRRPRCCSAGRGSSSSAPTSGPRPRWPWSCGPPRAA